MANKPASFIDPKLPSDLVNFLRAKGKLDYDPSLCEAGTVTLLPLEEIRVALYPLDADNNDIPGKDPHKGEYGCYLVQATNLIAACTGDYEPEGLLLWLPIEQRYATWDSSHSAIEVFGPKVTWQGIVKKPAHYINAQWGEGARTKPLVPWPSHKYSQKQLYSSQPAEE